MTSSSPKNHLHSNDSQRSLMSLRSRSKWRRPPSAGNLGMPSSIAGTGSWVTRAPRWWRSGLENYGSSGASPYGLKGKAREFFQRCVLGPVFESALAFLDAFVWGCWGMFCSLVSRCFTPIGFCWWFGYQNTRKLLENHFELMSKTMGSHKKLHKKKTLKRRQNRTGGSQVGLLWSPRYQDYNMVNLIGEGRNGAVFIAPWNQLSEQVARRVDGVGWVGWFSCLFFDRWKMILDTLFSNILNSYIFILYLVNYRISSSAESSP